MGAHRPAARFVLGVTLPVTGSSTSLDLTAFTAGDLILVRASFGAGVTTAITGGAGNWNRYDFTWTTLAYKDAMFWKVLEPTDIDTLTVTNTNAGGQIQAASYRGATVATLKDLQNEVTGTTLTFAGFNKAAQCKGIFASLNDRTNGLSSPTSPNWAPRVGPYFSGFFSVEAADTPYRVYVNGDPIVFSGFDPAAAQSGLLFELT